MRDLEPRQTQIKASAHPLEGVYRPALLLYIAKWWQHGCCFFFLQPALEREMEYVGKGRVGWTVPVISCSAISGYDPTMDQGTADGISWDKVSDGDVSVDEGNCDGYAEELLEQVLTPAPQARAVAFGTPLPRR